MADGAHDAATATAWITAAATAIGAMMGALALFLANRLVGKAAFQAAINAGYQGLLDRMEARHADERSQWHEERLQMRGEIVNLKQTLASMNAAMRRAGVEGLPEPEFPDPLITLHGPRPADRRNTLR